MNVTVVQSYRFPNCWTVNPVELENDGSDDSIRIFRDGLASDGSFACASAISYCKENGLTIKSYKVQHQFEHLNFGFDDDVEKVVLNIGKPAYYNGQPVA